MPDHRTKDLWDRADVIGKLLIPVILAIATYSLNRRQHESAQNQFYAQLMGQREQADTVMRKDMFKSIVETFGDGKADDADRAMFNMEVLAYNFHEALDLAPLFKHLHRVSSGPRGRLAAARLEQLANRIALKQVDALKEPDGKNIRPGRIHIDKLNPSVGGTGAAEDHGFQRVIPPESAAPDEKKERACVAFTEYRNLRARVVDVEVFLVDRAKREVQVRLIVSKPTDTCPDRLSPRVGTERDTMVTVSLFDFPKINNLRLENDDRLAVVLSRFFDEGPTDKHPQAEVQVIYFPGRAQA